MDSATSMVVEAALSVIFQLLAPPFLESLGLPFGVEKEAKRLKSTHLKIEALLTDAEKGQIKQESDRLWLRALKHVAYDAEDILDELECRALRSKIEEAAPIQTRKRKLTDRFRITHFFPRFSSKFELGSRIKEIRERLDEIERESNQFRLKVMYGSRSEMLGMRPPTSSIVDESSVFGREADREKVVGLLASDDSSAENGIGVVTISGMGGIGKTTLAQLAYEYFKRVVKHFEVRSWVFVSQDFDLFKVTKAILESLTNSPCHLTNFDTIQDNIMSILKEKRFLLVLDDVWNEKCNAWNALRAPLMVAARGSRILVTTRSHRVSSMMGTVPTHSLRCLSDDDCWSIFKRLAFVEGDSDVHPDLVMIGKEIVNKCKGLPLAVKTLGGLLRPKVNVEDWKSILESEIWDLPEEGNDILPALRLSYHHLPAHLKRCFEFCSVFPKGSAIDVTKGRSIIDVKELVWLWMALGFIQSEDIGKEYFADLVSRSLLDSASHRMHDLIHDLARSVSGAEILEIRDWKKSHKNAEKVRHVSCRLPGSSLESFNFENLYCFKSLRTLILSRDDNYDDPTDAILSRDDNYDDPTDAILSRDDNYDDPTDAVLTIPPDLFVKLRHIRILDLSCNHSYSYNDITELPESIGNLIQLRYLDLSRNMIKRLPKSIGRLYNLQTLKLNGCWALVEVPSDFRNLVNLRKISALPCSASIPFGGLKSLQYLDQGFKVGREIGYRVNELRDMNCLRKACISELENVNSVEEAKEAELKNKQKIRRLELNWRWNCNWPHGMDSRQEGIEEEVLNALQPHTNLERLRIQGYCGVRFPTWLGDSSFSKLVHIFLSTCKCRILPPFGQLPSLETLYLRRLYGLKKVGREVYGDGMVKGFPSLKMLFFCSMPDLEEWTALEGDMIHVSHIGITDCSKLRVLPDIFPLTLDSLRICGCPLLTSLGDEVLPATLNRLSFLGCGDLNRLPTGLKNLTTLADLVLQSCPKIHFLPEELPTSTLDRLDIRRCPLVTEKCKEGGEYWSKISHIPHIEIDDLVQKYAGEVMR